MGGRAIVPAKLRVLAAVVWLVSLATPALARLGVEYQMALGNPSDASTNVLIKTNYLMARNQYALSYNNTNRQANWASWSYSIDDIGADVARTDAFAADTDLPSDYSRVSSATFGGDWDRGHICPSEDRVASTNDNVMTFRMSNMMPQASANNRGPWARLEAYCRELAADGSEVLVTAGPAQFTGTFLANGMAIPGAVWKVAVVVTNAASSQPAASRVSTGCRVIAVLIPNTSSGLGSWQDYIVSVEEIERVTGFNFFSSVEASTAVYLKNIVDTGTEANTPTVVTSFSPSSGTNGTAVTIHGYNFGISPSVQIAGVPATVISSSSNTITAHVNNVSAGVGPIAVSDSNGTDVSYADFTVFGGTQPGFSLSTFTLSGLSCVEGKVGPVKSYSVSGANLAGAITVTAPSPFEISLNNGGGPFSNTVILTPSSGVLSSVPVYVRISSNAFTGAVAGTITHSGGGVSQQNLAVSGDVSSGSPSLSLSGSNLANFFGILGKTSASKSYLVSGVNLSNSITVATSSTNYEVSLNNLSFAPSVTLNPSNEALVSVPVFVRLSSKAPAGTNTAFLSHSGAGLSPLQLSLAGNVTSSNYLIAWSFFGTNKPVSLNPSSTDPSLDGILGLFRGTKAKETDGTNSFRTQSFMNDGISSTNADYFEFSLSVTNGKSLSLGQIQARLKGTDTFVSSNNFAGAANQFAYSTNGGPFVLVGSPTIITSTAASDMWVNLSGISALQNIPANTTVTFRFYASGQTATGGWGFYSDNNSVPGLAVAGTISQAPPVITSSLTASGTVRAWFNYLVTAENGPTLFGASGLPTGLAIDPDSGLISGAPRSTGVFPIVLTASNAAGQDSQTLQLTVQEPVNTNRVTLAKWTFESATNTNSGTQSAFFKPEEGQQTNTALASSVHASSSTKFTFPTGNGSSNGFSSDRWTTGDYFQFDLSSVGYRGLKLKFDQTASGTGPLRFKLSYSMDRVNFVDHQNYEIPKTSNAISWNLTNFNTTSTVNFDLSSLSQLANKTNLIFRLVQRDTLSMTNGTVQTTGTCRVDNVEISGLPVDTNAPVLLMTGNPILNLVAGGAWADPGVSAIDAEDVDVVVVTSGAVNPAVLGSYVLNYSATDSSGNSGSATRIVNIALNASNSLAADSDGNGMADLVEYALGGAPTGNSPSILPSPGVSGTNLRITFLARTNDSNLFIRPVVGTNLFDTNGWSTNGVVKTVGVATNNGFEWQTWETPVSGAVRKFLKINISR